MSDMIATLPASSPPRTSMIVWLRRLRWHPFNTLMSVVAVLVAAYIAFRFLDWAVIHAVWRGTPADCAAAAGACWAVIYEKHRMILFGLYPFQEQWRPFTSVIIYVCAVVITLNPRFWNFKRLLTMWAVVVAVIACLLFGGIFGLPFVPTASWGGLSLTMVMFTGTILLGMPLALLLALGRRSEMPLVNKISVAFIETLRGVPLITILFVAVNIFPLFLPAGVTFDKLLRVVVGTAIFFACYQAEAIRGGLQAVPMGQYEAARSLGLGYWRMMGFIVLPQALRISFPSMMNHIIGAMKNTSYVMIIGLFDVLTATSAVMQDPLWRRFYLEAYMFAGLIYFSFGISMSLYARAIEKRMKRGY